MARQHVLIALIAILGPASAQFFDAGDLGFDRPYSDLPGSPIQLNSTQKASDCAALCTNNAECFAWALTVPNCAQTGLLCYLKSDVPTLAPNACIISGVKNLLLRSKAYEHLPVGSILPVGWIRNQLELQVDGLAGYLQKFYPYVAFSIWIGGNTTDPDPTMLERVPYWLNGMVPTSYLLDDLDFRAQVLAYIEYILAHQNMTGTTGWFGPICCNTWPQWALTFALLQYHEATGDERILPAVDLNMRAQRDVIVKGGLGNGWSQVRWEELVWQAQYMYDNYPAGNKQFYLDLAEYARQVGFDWVSFYNSSAFPKVACRGSCPSFETHGVNTGEALKSSAVWWRQSGNETDIESTDQRIDLLWTYHGSASGVFTCSEHLAGLDPAQGTELCTVVEIMFSIEQIFSIFGGVKYLDMLEMVAYNALPAAITPDMWAHVYLTESNAVNAQHSVPDIWTTDGPDSNIYGLQPNYGCCTVNFPQGWAKFITHAYMTTQDAGLVSLVYMPVNVTTRVRGQIVNVLVTTDYPFDEVVTIVVTTEGGFPLFLPVPGWCNTATVQVGGADPVPAPADELFRVDVPPGGVKIVVTLPMSFRIVRRFNDAVSIYRGPLLYSLKFAENWTQLAYYAYNSSDWQMEPGSPWQYALLINETDLDSSLHFVRNGPPGTMPFSPNSYPVSVLAQGRLIADQWGMYDNAAAQPPQSPVTSTSPLVQLTLIPHGATDLRIAEFPTLMS